MNIKEYKQIEEIIGYSFKDDTLLLGALTHSSYANECRKKDRYSYERLEFLGDAVLELIVSNYLFERYKNKAEGELTRLRASMVCEFTLSDCAKELKLGEYAWFSKGEEQTGGRTRSSILCDLFESMLGAIYLDGGMEECKTYVYKFLLKNIDKKRLFYDAKTNLQEYAQKIKLGDVSYELVGEEGPQHNKSYKTSVLIGGKPYATGIGHSLKNSEQMAAYEALLIIHKDDDGENICI